MRQFYGVNIKPFSNGITRWTVYELIPHIPPKLEKLWPDVPSNCIQAINNGWTYSKNKRYPAYHIRICEIGTSHIHLLKEQIAFILWNEYGKPHGGWNKVFNEINLEILE